MTLQSVRSNRCIKLTVNRQPLHLRRRDNCDEDNSKSTIYSVAKNSNLSAYSLSILTVSLLLLWPLVNLLHSNSGSDHPFSLWTDIYVICSRARPCRTLSFFTVTWSNNSFTQSLKSQLSFAASLFALLSITTGMQPTLNTVLVLRCKSLLHQNTPLLHRIYLEVHEFIYSFNHCATRYGFLVNVVVRSRENFYAYYPPSSCP